jgi:Tfp pilus assembly PilM family ATPase
MKQNTDCFCGIDFQSDYFSTVQYSLKDRAITLISIQPFPTGKRAGEWKTWRRELKNGKPRLSFFCPFIAGAIPAQYAIIKLVSVDADEPSVEDALKWELEQQVVGEPADFVFDAQEMTGVATGKTRTFLLVAYRRALVEQTAEMIRSAKFKPLAIGLDIFGLINVFEANYRERSAAPCLLIHCEEEMTKLVLSRSGEFLDFRCCDTGNYANDETAFSAAVAGEIDRFCSGRRPEAMYATGSWFQQVLRREAFFETVKGVELLNPFREIKCQVVIDEQQLKEYSTQLAVAVGLALQRASIAGEADSPASGKKPPERSA